MVPTNQPKSPLCLSLVLNDPLCLKPWWDVGDLEVLLVEWWSTWWFGVSAEQGKGLKTLLMK